MFNNSSCCKNLRNSRFLLILGISFTLVMGRCRPPDTPAEMAETVEQTPLDQYVSKPDPNFRYQVVFQDKRKNYTYYVLEMVSQHWLTKAEVDEPEWWHWIKIVIPDSIDYDTGLMWIGGGAKDDSIPVDPGEILLQSALLTHSITAEIHNIPNQALTFTGDDYGPRFEDEIIAFGWRKFLEGGARDEDAIWLSRLPMTKAVIRAMDAVSDITEVEFGLELDHYVVAGASKRGWTTWTTAAVDDRVVAMVPIVIDLLNIVPSFEHHWRNYGFWAPAITNYVEEGIMEWIRTPEFARLLEITEPYSYLERYDMPKLMINATGDQFFQPDSWKFYWDDLKGDKYVRYVPNTGHSLQGSDALNTLVSFYQYILLNDTIPRFDWHVEGSVIEIITDPDHPPASLRLWQAESKETPRDFRIDVIGEAWNPVPLNIDPGGLYTIRLTHRGQGWKAFFVEGIFESEGKLPLKLTTGVTVLPEVYPYEPFQIKENPDPDTD